ncbi:CD9 antigen isoform X2 [Parasteatoda tepidariorum]|uniref:Tetraspanin n=1 Tax=Parasteatoda tepidariorum TaxID=114398 RepID=A0A2L2XZT6_PARTP|nr:CD9 antigen isoform X2 [Parasteatoda tepidariorum]
MVANADPATSLMKYVIFAINFVIYVMGGAILAVGIWIRSDSDFWEYHRALDIGQFYQASYVAIALGAIVLIIGFFGCCGAAMNSPCMLFTYMVMLVFVLILELTTAGLVWKHADGEKFQIFLTDSIKEQINRGIHENPDSARFVDLLQLHLECCGGYDMHDYHMDDIPQSCSSDRTNNVFIHGCGENIRRYLEQKAGALGGIALGSVLIQVLCLIFSGCLFCIMREDEREYTY